MLNPFKTVIQTRCFTVKCDPAQPRHLYTFLVGLERIFASGWEVVPGGERARMEGNFLHFEARRERPLWRALFDLEEGDTLA